MATAITIFLSLLPILPTPTLGVIPLSFIKLFASVLFAWWLLRGLIQRRISIPFSPILFFTAGFVLTGAISTLWANNLAFSLHKVFVWFAIFPLIAVFGDQLRNHIILRHALKGLVIVTGLLALTSTVQFFTQFVFGIETTKNFLATYITPVFVGVPAAEGINQNSSWLVNIGGTTLLRAVAVFPDPHTLALFLGLTIPFSVWLFFAASGTKQKKIYLCMLAVLASALLFTFSRGAYLAFLGSAAVFVVLLWQKLSASFKKQFILISAIILVIVLVLGQPVVSRLVSSFNPQEGSNAGRLAIWSNAIETIAQHPFLGVGLGNYPFTQDSFVASRSPINAHNTYLEIAAETGIVGLALWLGIFITSFFVLARALKKKSDYYEYIFVAAIASSLSFYCIHALFETVIYSPPNLVLLTVILALVMHAERRTRETGKTTIFNSQF